MNSVHKQIKDQVWDRVRGQVRDQVWLQVFGWQIWFNGEEVLMVRNHIMAKSSC